MSEISVDTAGDLLDAIDTSSGGDVIDASDVARNVSPPGGSTLDGDGVVVKTDSAKSSIIQITNPETTVRGVEFRGDLYDQIQENGSWSYEGDRPPTSSGLDLRRSDALVENCSFRGFGHAGVRMGAIIDGDRYTPTLRGIMCVDNNARALGYGIVVYSGYPLIEGCYLNNNRHDIAGSGVRNCGYEVRDTHFGPNGRIYGAEMHDPGGESVHVHRCTFEDKRHGSTGDRRRLIVNRGTPTDECRIERCWFKADIDDHGPITSLRGDSPEFYTFERNHFGPTDPPGGVGAGAGHGHEESNGSNGDESRHGPRFGRYHPHTEGTARALSRVGEGLQAVAESRD